MLLLCKVTTLSKVTELPPFSQNEKMFILVEIDLYLALYPGLSMLKNMGRPGYEAIYFYPLSSFQLKNCFTGSGQLPVDTKEIWNIFIKTHNVLKAVSEASVQASRLQGAAMLKLHPIDLITLIALTQ